ncbi:MAG: DUF3488 and transglutaminase-like domain-containing protein [Opitutus sp.]
MKSSRKSATDQLTVGELQQLKWMLGGVLTLVSVATVFYLDIAAWTLMALTVAAVIAVTLWPWLPGRVPRWAHRLAFPIIVATFTADLWLSGELLPAGVRLDILLLLYRAITYRQKRDDLQVIVLGLFLIVVAGVLTVSLTFAVHILAFTGCALAMLLVITLAEASAGFKSMPQPPGTTPEWATAVNWPRLLGRVRQVTDWRVVTMGVGLFAGLVVLSGLLFVAIPRFQLENGLFLERFITKQTRSGFSETIRFGDVTDIQQDNSVALSVDVSDRSQIPAIPYWRMLVLDEYREGIFRLSAAARRGAAARGQRGTIVRGSISRRVGSPAVWTFYLESGISRYLPLLGAFEELKLREPHSFQMLRGLELVALRDDPATMIAYRVEGMQTDGPVSDVRFGEELAAVAKTPSPVVSSMISLPVEAGDLTKLERISRELGVSGENAAADFSRKASAWLAQHHTYTLQPKTPAGAGDPLIRWLASSEPGHCELFAGSFVMLARNAGLPARLVTGFRGGSWNSYSNNFTLRNSDAHAWCEVYDQKSQAWLRVDPTPGSGSTVESNAVKGEAALARRNDRSWKARLESLRVFWYRQIVSFDQRSQLDTINSVKEATEQSSRRFRAALDDAKKNLTTWLSTPWNAERVARVLAKICVVLTIGVLGTQLYRRFRFKWGSVGGKRSGDRLRTEAGRWLVRLATSGLDPATDPELRAALDDLRRIRFGKRESWGDVNQVLQRARNVGRSRRRRVARERR